VTRWVLLAVAALAVAACGETARERVAAPPAPPSAAVVAATAPASGATAAPTCHPGIRTITDARHATVLYVVRKVTAWSNAHHRVRAVALLGPTNSYGIQTVLLGVDALIGRDCAAHWYRAKLPAKPNGVTGWVAAAAVATADSDRRVIAELSRRVVIVYRDGRPVFRARVAIGAPGTPTPTGQFFVESRFHLTDPGGPYGPAALAIAAYSDAPQGWTRGNPIAIHGTNEPASIGLPASHGCLRMRNADVMRIMSLVPAGTPVEIRA
jgi:lipoprotein-anchoring transpeptidase ErfK/SrfK